jgi:predicted DNA-binding protein
MMKGKRLVTWSIRVDDALDAAVKKLAEKDLRTTSNYVEKVIRQHVAELGIDLTTVEVPRKEPKAKKPAEKKGRGK